MGEERAHGWQIALAVGAVLAALPWLALGVESTLVLVLFAFCGLPVAAPLLALRKREEFVRTCIGAASFCIFWAVCGFMLGTFVLLPSALLLLLAAGADPRRQPVTARFLGIAGILLATGAVPGATVLVWDLMANPGLA